MANDNRAELRLDPAGFNEIRMCRTGPLLFNKYDVYVGGSLKKYGEFSEAEQLLFRQIVRPGALVVEVGANVGAHTVALSKLAGPEGEVHALEPQRLVFQALCANLALNQCTNVFARQCAAGAAPGTLYVPALPANQPANFGGVSMVDTPTGEPVRAITVDSLDLPFCHFLKIDVEGMEIDVLRGAQATIDSYRPLLYVENDREEKSQRLLELIFGLDYRAYWHFAALFNPDNFSGDRENIFADAVSCSVFCVPQESELVVGGCDRVASTSETWRTKLKAPVSRT
jgi:FkbM family methyltransferase